MISQLIFFYFAAVIVISSILTVASRNLVHGALFLLLMFFHMAGLYVILNAEFLAMVQIIVYAGGILVLYLFTITLMNVDKEVIKERFHKNSVMAASVASLILFSLVVLFAGRQFTLTEGAYSVEFVKANGGNAFLLGKELFTTFLFPFEVASVILLLAMVGAIVLVKKKI